MKYTVAKAGYVALTPSVTVAKSENDEVLIMDEDHANGLIHAGVLKDLGSAPKNKMDNPPQNKSVEEPDEFKDLSDDDLKAKYQVVMDKEPSWNATRKSMIKKISEAE